MNKAIVLSLLMTATNTDYISGGQMVEAYHPRRVVVPRKTKSYTNPVRRKLAHRTMRRDASHFQRGFK